MELLRIKCAALFQRLWMGVVQKAVLAPLTTCSMSFRVKNCSDKYFHL